MSKLVRAVYAKEGAIRAVRSPLNALTVTESWKQDQYPTVPKLEREYHIGVELRHKMVFSSDAVSEAAVVDVGKQMVKKAIVEEVFGEFRPHFRAINLALWERDFDKALAALRAMEVQMFSAEE